MSLDTFQIQSSLSLDEESTGAFLTRPINRRAMATGTDWRGMIRAQKKAAMARLRAHVPEGEAEYLGRRKADGIPGVQGTSLCVHGHPLGARS